MLLPSWRRPDPQLATYLQGLGIGINADRVNKLLVLLAVLVIECGGDCPWPWD